MIQLILRTFLLVLATLGIMFKLTYTDFNLPKQMYNNLIASVFRHDSSTNVRRGDRERTIGNIYPSMNLSDKSLDNTKKQNNNEDGESFFNINQWSVDEVSQSHDFYCHRNLQQLNIEDLCSLPFFI